MVVCVLPGQVGRFLNLVAFPDRPQCFVQLLGGGIRPGNPDARCLGDRAQTEDLHDRPQHLVVRLDLWVKRHHNPQRPNATDR